MISSRRKALRTFAAGVPLLPAIVLLAMFMLGPALWSIYGSMTNAALTGRAARDPQFVGFDNYARLFADPEFAKSVGLTVIFTVGSAVLGQNLCGMAVALINQAAHGVVRAVVGTAVIAAWVLPEIVAAFALYAFFQSDGSLNAAIAGLGLTPVDWLYAHPMFSVIMANIWRGTAFSMMVYSAALAEVPHEISEAAEVDGAGTGKRFWFITLPIIKRSISTNLMLTTLQTLSVFTLIFVMTAGGPGTDSSTLPIMAYQVAFKFAEIGYGTAVATVLLAIGAVFSVIYLRMLRPPAERRAK